MIIKVRQGNAETGKPQHGRLFAEWVLLCALLSLPAVLPAQVEEAPAEQLPTGLEEAGRAPAVPEIVVVTLPESQQMALALSTPELRRQALLDLAAAANVLTRAAGKVELDHAALAQNFLDDRAWLQMLVDRHGWVEPRSSVLDPAAWLVVAELQQHDLSDLSLVFPGRTPGNVLIYQVFQRSGQRLAAANLPVLLLEIESGATVLWDQFLELVGPANSPDAAWKEVEVSWFTDREIPLAEDIPADLQTAVENIPQAMSKLVESAVDVSPPDSRELMRIRYSLLDRTAEPAPVEDTSADGQAANSLHLASLIDGLHEGRYFEFVQGLLSITSRLLEDTAGATETSFLVDWLVTELPAISEQYAAGFSVVDSRLNPAMAAAYWVLQDIAASAASAASDEDAEVAVVVEPPIKESRAILADAVAQLTLLIPDMGYYFDMPVRARIVEEIDICVSIAASQDENGASTMARSQFDACMDNLVKLADQDARLAELSGDINGPFTTDTLRRELNVSAWQRINYGIGYMHRRYASTCQPPANALPNPLEWAVLANTMTWFAEHSPEFFYTPENEARLTKMRSIGEQLFLGLSEQAACLASAGTGNIDLVSRSMTDYELALRELDLGVKSAELDFRTQRLRPGSDVLLDRNAMQSTAYRPDDLVIMSCEEREVCDMSGSLSTTRALIGLFPDEYLVAEQTGLGQIEICYRNMEWVERRSELVRADDENVANYFGRLGFDLVGQYVENDQSSEVFGFRFTSPDEYHYLFAQASEEVLDDSCPVEWVGSRVVTPLRENRGGIVPDRLTYLAASRNLPSRLLQSNWDQGAEWRDWFVTGIGVSPLELPPAEDITTRLGQHLQSLYQAEQAEIYQRLLIPNARNSEGDDVSLFSEMSQVSINKALIRMQMLLFYPESLLNSDSIRTAIAGDKGLLDVRILRRFREDDIALTSVNGIARERLLKLRQAWSQQTETVRQQGSIPTSLMHAMTRTNIIYRQFFIPRPEPLQEIMEASEPADESLQDPG